MVVVDVRQIGLREQSQPHGARRVVFELPAPAAFVAGRDLETSGAERQREIGPGVTRGHPLRRGREGIFVRHRYPLVALRERSR